MNKYDTLLDLFTGGSNNQKLAKPFLIGEDVISTDAHKLIALPKSLCEGVYEVGVIKSLPEWKTKEVKIKIPTSLFLEAFASHPDQEPEMILISGGVKECDECKGEGEVCWDYRRWSKEFDCPACDGEGEHDTRNYRKTGKTVPPYNGIFSIHETHFYYNVLSVIPKVAEILESEIILEAIGEIIAVFRIGEAKVIVMAKHKYEEDKPIKFI